MVQLSDDIIEEILCRLPVKSLLRFRSLSKYWLAIISSSYFVKLHMNQSVQTKSNFNLLQMHYDLYRVDLDSLHDGDVLQPVKIDPIPLNFWHSFLRTWIYGLRSSCDGLFCMSKVFDIDDVFLWNLSIRKFIKLPYESIDLANPFGISKSNTFCDYRIGYDNTNDDYKVLRIAKPYDKLFAEFKVYSLRSNSWHSLENFPQFPIYMYSYGDSIAGGALHWISIVKLDLKRGSLIVAFDLGTEKYRIIPHPQPEYREPQYKLYLHNFGGCLSLSCHNKSFTVDVFLLKEYGGKNEHWSRLFKLSATTSFEIHYPLKLIAYSKSGKKILFDMGYKRLVLYSLEQKSVEEIKVKGTGMEPIIMRTYVESLVSLDVPTTM